MNPSKMFEPWIIAERANREAEMKARRGKRSRRDKQPVQVKIGHGGTLDPMATGVLIVGVGKGTKSLQSFLDGTKSYETVVVFGAATDTYDAEGKIVKRAPYEHITKVAVEEALAKFRGDIMQKPPIFSALRVQGKRLYEYAREGKEVPVEIKERPVTVSELELVEWMDPGTHRYQFPNTEANQEEKIVADKLLHLVQDKHAEETNNGQADEVKSGQADASNGDQSGVEQTLKRKLDDESETPSLPKRTKQDDPAEPSIEHSQENQQPETQPEDQPSEEHKPCMAPAARIRMTVTSGFYVRSLCHDLGVAVDSAAFMAELARTRASEFELGKNTLEYDDLEKGEEVWGPVIQRLLGEWNDDPVRQNQPAKRQTGSAPNKESGTDSTRRIRNSSSPEA